LLFVQRFGNTSLGFNSLFSLLFISFIGLFSGFSNLFGIRVQFIHEFIIFQGIFVLFNVSNKIFFGWSNNRLDFIRVNDS